MPPSKKVTDPVGRLEALVSIAEAVREVPGDSPCTDLHDAEDRAERAWTRYLRTAQADLAALTAAGPEVDLLLGRLKACKNGWVGRANTLEAIVRPKSQRRRRTEETSPDGAPRRLPDPDTWKLLSKVGDVHPKPEKTQSNVILILANDPRMKGRLRHNQLRDAIELDGTPIRDNDYTGIGVFVQDNYGISLPERALVKAVQWVGRLEGNSYHPIQGWLRAIRWDGKKRIHKLLTHYFGAVPTEHPRFNDLAESVSVRWMVGCIARAMDPGCKMDTVLVLQGKEGTFKSTAFEVLCGPEWFNRTSIPDVRTKDAMVQLKGSWFLEIQEVERWTKSRDPEAVTAFLTTANDQFRAFYGAESEPNPRMVIFVGTTNKPRFLTPERNRRFWPFAISMTNLADLRADRTQLWAEAMVRYLDGTQWHLTNGEGEEETWMDESLALFRAEDPWLGAISNWLSERKSDQPAEFALSVVLSGIGVRAEGMDDRADHRAGMVLRSLGYESYRARGKDALGRETRHTMWRPAQPISKR